MATSADDSELDVKTAARISGRTAETIRRWVWSGRLPARKSGNRLLVKRADVEHIAGGSQTLSLGEWLAMAEHELRRHRGPYRSAADLVIEERRRRADEVAGHRSR
ncbi:MAG TPA: helix-turn-helix domain-containing protein [Candidatus Dormibacteraeota bacterium]|nr:helix-turn-helix domain-containing protein [Candidatus Dormibacteraeota bacterium]